MSSERVRRMMKEAEETTTSAIRDLQESHDLRHLYGQPLDLSDDSPDWYVRKLLKREGLAPPLVERGKDLNASRREAEAIVTRLRRRRDWLTQPEARCTAEMARAFNEARARALDDYRDALIDLNRRILSYNLAAPPALHHRGIIVDRAVDDAAGTVPPLDPLAVQTTPPPAPTGLRSFWRRRHGAR